jgi:hypothetical protein
VGCSSSAGDVSYALSIVPWHWAEGFYWSTQDKIKNLCFPWCIIFVRGFHDIYVNPDGTTPSQGQLFRYSARSTTQSPSTGLSFTFKRSQLTLLHPSVLLWSTSHSWQKSEILTLFWRVTANRNWVAMML